MGSFETSDQHSSRNHQPIRVPSLKGDIFGAAKEMCADMDGWTIKSADDEALTISCEKKNGMLGGTSSITVRVEGPDGMPSSTTYVKSASAGLLSRDKGNVAEFVKKFTMRVI